MSAEVSRQPGYGEGKTALLEATVRVVADSGLRNLTYRSVAARAGVAHGLVRHHFGSRDALIADALRYVMESSVSATSLEPGTGSVDDFVANLVSEVTSNPETQAFQFELIIESRRRPELRPLIKELYGAYRAATRRELARMGVRLEPGLDILVFAALDGLVFEQLALGEVEDSTSALMALKSMLRQMARESGS